MGYIISSVYGCARNDGEGGRNAGEGYGGGKDSGGDLLGEGVYERRKLRLGGL